VNVNRTSLQNLFKHWTPARSLLAVLVLGLIHGLVYVFLIPPWQHNDEPGHFEYVYLAAHWPRWPQRGEFDPQFRERLVDSLKATGWYKKYRSLDPSQLNPFYGSEIGPAQAGDIPGYYFLASMALRLVPAATGLIAQLTVVRLFSLALSVLTIFLAWKAMEELAPPGHALRWMVPAFLALLPGYADLMTAVSNDVGAVAAGALFLWLSLCLIRRRLSPGGLLGWVGSLVLCFFMNETSRLLSLTAPLVLLLTFASKRVLRAVLLATAGIFVLALPFSLRGGAAAAWYQTSAAPVPDRVRAQRAPFGQEALQLVYYPGQADPTQTGQFIPENVVQPLREKSLTVGVWMWADRPVEAIVPFLFFMTPVTPIRSPVVVSVGTEPAFYAQTVTVPFEAIRATLIVPGPVWEGPAVHLYYDGFVMAEGSYPQAPPEFADASLTRGSWGGRSFTNLVRNPSIEESTLTVQPWVDRAVAKVPIVNGRASLILTSLLDWVGAGWYYRSAASQLFQTFWARVAAGNGRLPGIYDYDVLQWLSVVAAAGLAGLLWRRRATLPLRLMFFLGTLFVAAWGAALLRGAPELINNNPVVPWARYAGAVIVISAFVICAGWHEVLRWISARCGLGSAFTPAAFLALMGGIASYSLLSFSAKYYDAAIQLNHLILFALLILFCFQVVKGSLAWLRADQED
jgi:hypothetical protein